MLNRRNFSKLVLGSGLLASDNLRAGGSAFLFPGQDTARPASQDCDLLIKGGTVIDPGQRLHSVLDVAVRDGKILEVSKDFPESRARKVVSAKDKIVTPGFIDLHVHCFDGFGGMNADHYCLGRGVTTVVDCGSAGYFSIDGFVKYIVDSSLTRIRALVDIAALGLLLRGATAKETGHVSSEGFMKVMDNPDWIYPQLTAKAAEQNKPAVVGIKVRLAREIQGPRDLECLKSSLDAAESAHLPLMAHIQNSYSPLPEILKMMRKGDVFTHIYNSHPHGILDANGKILPEVLEARQRGIFFDPAQGVSHVSFDTTEKALQQGFLPDTISTDLSPQIVGGPVFDLPTQVSKFIALGMGLEKAIELVTVKPAQIFDYGIQIGTLRPQNEADIGIFELQEGKFVFEDSHGEKRTGSQLLVNKAVVRRGQLYINQP
jgi:dihydroorotase